MAVIQGELITFLISKQKNENIHHQATKQESTKHYQRPYTANDLQNSTNIWDSAVINQTTVWKWRDSCHSMEINADGET